jgi:hypothetical protein
MIWAQLGVITTEHVFFLNAWAWQKFLKWEVLYFAFRSPASIKGLFPPRGTIIQKETVDRHS